MSITETIHTLNPLWLLVPAGLTAFAFLLDDFAGRKFKKSEEELEEDRADRLGKEREQIKLWKEAVNREEKK